MLKNLKGHASRIRGPVGKVVDTRAYTIYTEWPPREGSPVSPIIANFFMEDLEHRAVATAPVEAKPKLWKRYVDDILEIVKEDQVDNLTQHLNQIDETGSNKFTYATEQIGSDL